MKEYSAPVKEILFAMNELAGLPELSKLPGFETATPDIVEAVINEAAKLAGDVLSPLNRSGDIQGARLVNGGVQAADGFAEAYRAFVDAGWLSLPHDPDLGGQGLPYLLNIATSEMWNSANLSFSLCPMLSSGAIDALTVHASEELKNLYLEKLISGEWTGTMNLTEPQAGSDLGALKSKATPHEDHYLISGQKIFITWGDHDLTENILHLVLARLPDAPPGVKGISMFLVPKFLVNPDGSLAERNDVSAVALEHKLGIHASPTCVMSYGENTGAVGYLIGEPHQGLSCMFTMMNLARLAVGVEGIGLSQRAYQAAVEYARERVQGYSLVSGERVAIIEHADVRRMLMLMRAQTEATRAVAYMSAATFDQAQNAADDFTRKKCRSRLDLLTPIVKAWSTEVAQEVTGLGIQVHGGMGFIEETGVAQYYRDARITTIYEGTTGIQANDLVGRKLMRDGGSAYNRLLDEIESLCKSLMSESDPILLEIGNKLAPTIDTLRTAAKIILEKLAAGQLEASAFAFNFLMMTGTVLGGWQMARSAQVASRKLAEESGDSFYAAKLQTAIFYIANILPRITAWMAPLRDELSAPNSQASTYDWGA